MWEDVSFMFRSDFHLLEAFALIFNVPIFIFAKESVLYRYVLWKE